MISLQMLHWAALVFMFFFLGGVLTAACVFYRTLFVVSSEISHPSNYLVSARAMTTPAMLKANPF
jgi:hypothetical protein